jgi:hypothetical protein
VLPQRPLWPAAEAGASMKTETESSSNCWANRDC